MNFEDLIFKSSLHEKAERYDDMSADMRKALEIAIEEKLTLGFRERSLYSVAFKNVVGHQRASWRVLVSERKKHEAASPGYAVVDEYVRRVEEELKKTCDIVLEQVRRYLAALITPVQPVGSENRVELQPGEASVAELRVFFLKMVGDYCRYKAEVDESEANVSGSLAAYSEAFELAKIALQPTNPVRLGLALNFSVFYYEIAKDAERACVMARQALDDSIGELDKLSEEHYKDSTLIMQLLRDNLTLWTSRCEEEENQNEDANVSQEGEINNCAKKPEEELADDAGEK
ncbi:14-3-3 protein beta/alpha-A [Dictyocoela roeselum]|nr:14-3-3 protein beta/alpha-A [Dictyocoela roeselum]